MILRRVKILLRYGLLFRHAYGRHLIWDAIAYNLKPLAFAIGGGLLIYLTCFRGALP